MNPGSPSGKVQLMHDDEQVAAAPPEEEAITPETAADIAEAGGEPAAEPAVEEAVTGPRLIVKRSGAETDTVFAINSGSIIGRFDPAVGPIDVDLGSLPEGVYVSRKHARLDCDETGVWKVVDLGSSNGTFILRGDFERVEEAELEDGSEFALGNARFVFRMG
jgi:pSer/pThr/pTyr-binding forkhead associated (FHA) protein